MIADPGTHWEYGIGLDWAGRVVEEVSGERLDGYFRAHIFEPLSMEDTGFAVDGSREDRLATVHTRGADGMLAPIPFATAADPEFLSGGGGLYSSAPDYMRFMLALLGAGAGVLKAETVRTMMRNQIGGLEVGPLRSVRPQISTDFELFPGLPKKWGYGFLINSKTVPGRRSAGSLAWAGIANTHYWLDPAEGIAAVLLTQVLPFGDSEVLDLLEEFETSLYAGLRS